MVRVGVRRQMTTCSTSSPGFWYECGSWVITIGGSWKLCLGGGDVVIHSMPREFHGLSPAISPRTSA